MNRLAALFLFSISLCLSTVAAEGPVPHLEHNLNYTLNLKELEKGNFQYFYCLLSTDFENLSTDQSVTPVEDILKVFLPLDTKKLWDPKDGNYLAVAKFTYILPISVQSIDEAKFTDTEYLQSTLPKYKVTKHDRYYHVSGSFITPDFNVTVRFLDQNDPLVNKEKMKAGKFKASFMHQDSFGRVMMFRTAKMASALIIYEDLGPKQTLVTQFILSNVINVPTRDLIRKGMIENLQNVVRGSRSTEVIRQSIQTL